MLDLSKIKRRYFELKLGGEKLELEPPKVKTLKNIMALSKELGDMDESEIDFDAVTRLTEVITGILSKNKQKKKFDAEYVEDNIDLDDMILILESYFEWVGKVQSDPN